MLVEPGPQQASPGLMRFVQFNEYPNVAEAITNAAVFADLDTLAAAGLLAPRDGGNLSGNIVNWGLLGKPPEPVPAPGALWLVGAGLFGPAAAPRRNRRG